MWQISQRQGENSLAQKVTGGKDEYTPISLVVEKSVQHLQSEWVEPGHTLVASVVKLHMMGTCGLQEGVTERVAQENSNAVDLHEKMQAIVDGRDLPVNQAVTAVGGGTEEDSSPMGYGHEELVQMGTIHAESVIEGTE